MNIDYINEFLVLADAKNYSFAAESLYISQATLSRHIIALEAELGGKLFDRTSRKLELTSTGIWFLPYASRLVGLEQQYLNALRQAQEKHINQLIIGVQNNLHFYGTSDLLVHFADKFPDICINIMDENSRSIKTSIIGGELDCGFIKETYANKPDGLSRINLITDQLIIAMPVNHRLANNKAIDLLELSGENVMLPPKNSNLNALCAKILKDVGCNTNPIFNGNIEQGVIDMVCGGKCVAIMQKRMAEIMSAAADNIKFVPIDPAVHVYINFVYLCEHMTQAESQFIDFLCDNTTLADNQAYREAEGATQ